MWSREQGEGGVDTSSSCLMEIIETELGEGGFMRENNSSYHEFIEVLCSGQLRFTELKYLAQSHAAGIQT